VEFHEYLSWDALNFSSLKKIAQTPRKFRLAMDHPEDKITPSKLFGTACHAMLLEPQRFKENVIAPPVHPSGKYEGKAFGKTSDAYQVFLANNPGKFVLDSEDLEKLACIQAEVDAHPHAAALLQAEGPREVVMVWADPTTGLRCKGRADLIVPKFGIVDVKTTEDASVSAFSRSLVDYSYPAQCAFYCRGLRELRNAKVIDTKDHFVFIAIESEPDHGITIYTLGHDTLRAGEAQVSEYLRRVKACLDSGEWPSYPTDVQPIEAPSWWISRWINASE
jgi:exodeoxyribonuclease VIII